MDNSLNDLIRRTRDNTSNSKYRNGDVSHVILIPNQQFITIKRTKLEEFWLDYCKMVYKGEGTYSLAEMNDRDMPVVVMMTFRFNRENISDEIFTDKFLIELIYAWQEAIKDKLDVSYDKRELACICLESQAPWQEGNSTFYEVRFQFPYCKTESTSISKIRDKAISILRKRNSLKLLEATPENDWDKIVDPHAHLEPLLLYKGIRAVGRPRLTFSSAYDEITPSHLKNEEVAVLELRNTFDPRSHSCVIQGLIHEEIFEEAKDADRIDPLFWLPLILSVNYSNTLVLAKTEDNIRDSSSNSAGDVPSFDDKESDLVKARYFIQFLKQERAVDIFSWQDVGRALFSSSFGNEDGLQAWIDFTEQSDHFMREDCEKFWSTFDSNTPVTYRSIAWFAKQDNPEEYRVWHENWCQESLEKAFDFSHANVAEWIYRLYWLEIACASADKSTWLTFNGVRWVHRERSIVITEKINKEVIPRLERIRIEISRHVHSVSDKSEKNIDENRIKAITELISKLSDQRFIGLIVKAAATPFHINYERFSEYADSNPDLMGCEDCVIEVIQVEGKYVEMTTGITTRSGKPEDYVTMNTKMSLKRHKYSWGHPDVKKVVEWIEKVHTDSTLRQEWFKEVASWLRGRNVNKRVSIWTGDKDNSKSLTIRCIELAFGQYFGKFPTSMFTGKRTSSSNANPELARSRGRHAMIIQETDEDTETFRKGIMKELTGGDTVFARLLHDNGGEFLPMFKLCIVCNKVPNFVGSDEAIKERVQIIPFLSKWSNDASDDPEEQYKTRRFKKDPTFESKIPILAPAMLWVLIQYYPKYVKEGLKQPPIVKAYTEKYWQDQDHYKQYVDDCIVIVEKDHGYDKSANISHTELFRHFKSWLLDSRPGSKLPDSNTAKKSLEKYLPGFENKKWYGIRIARDDDVVKC